MHREFSLPTFRFISFFLLFSLAVLFFSCSNAESGGALSDETPTLRSTAASLYDSTLWTEEIEFDRLSANVSKVEGISSKLNLSPLIVSACIPAQNSQVFPSLDSFGSLDTSLIPPSLRKMLTTFSETLSKNKDADSFFVKDNLYSLALFYNDFNRIFGECFGLDKIQEEKNDFPAPSSDGKNASPSGEGSAETESVHNVLYFTSFKLGQPFLDGIFYEVPVKFFSKKATLTLSVFCFEDAGAWKIDQIQISDWEIF